jgi:peptide/nickel transport system permease protein
MGTYALDALANADYAPLQGFVLCIAIVFTLLNLSIDLLLLALDPRARTRLR